MISEVHNIDCMDAMREMNDNQFDLAIVSYYYYLYGNNNKIIKHD